MICKLSICTTKKIRTEINLSENYFKLKLASAKRVSPTYDKIIMLVEGKVLFFM